MKASVDNWHKENDVELRYDQFGWKNEDQAFLVGKTLYTPTDIRRVNGSQTLEQRASYLGPSTRKGASFERWQRAANKMFAEGMEHQSLALLCGFAAPLMRFHAEGEGGAIVSFISDRTSSGKTTALEAAASIWGEHRGIKLDETDTRVAKGLKLGLLGNLPCTFDELHERDPELIRQFVLIFTNGTDKDRGTAEGGLKINKADWQTILVVAGNASLVDLLSNHDASDAPAARILEFETALPDRVTKEDFEHLRRELAYNCGFAGDLFMRKLVQPEMIRWIKQNIPAWSTSVRKAAGLEEKHRFWVRLIVSIIAAGTIVEKLGILDFSMQRITKWLIAAAADRRDIIISGSKFDAASALSLFMAEHRRDTLSVATAYKAGQRSAVVLAPQGQLLCRYESDTKQLYITESALKKWLVKKSINITGFTTTLFKQGVLVGAGVRKYTLGAGTEYASGQIPCYRVNLANPMMSGVVTTIEEAHPDKLFPDRQERLKAGGL